MTLPPDLNSVRPDIGGIPIPSMAAKFGTPLQIVHRDRIDEWPDQAAGFDLVRHHISVVDPPQLLRRIAERGGSAVAAGPAEIDFALQSGFGPHSKSSLIFAGDFFDDASLKRCAKLGLRVRCGSPDMITQLGRIRPGCEIALHVNVGLGMTPSQSGIWHDQVDDCCLRADQDGITITGLHVDVAESSDLEATTDLWNQAAAVTEGLARLIGRPMMGLSIGTNDGWSSDSIGRAIDVWNPTRASLAEEFGHSVGLELDAGNSLRAAAMSCIGVIRALKSVGRQRYYLVDIDLSGQELAVCAANADASLRQHSQVTLVSRDGKTSVQQPLPSLAIGDFVVVGGVEPTPGTKTAMIADGKATLAN